MVVYETIAEDLTHLGGPMGSEYTTRNSLGLFNSLNKAKNRANYHYNNETGHIRTEILKWREYYDHSATQDLGFIQYHVYEREVK